MDAFYTMGVQRAGLQALETSYIIGTSKNIETIKGRYKFLQAVYEGSNVSVIGALKQAQNDPQYPACMKLAIEQYKNMYPGRDHLDFQLTILSNPNGFDLVDFYCTALVS